MASRRGIPVVVDGRRVLAYGEDGAPAPRRREEPAVRTLIARQGPRRRLAMVYVIAAWLDRRGMARMAQRGSEWRVRG